MNQIFAVLIAIPIALIGLFILAVQLFSPLKVWLADHKWFYALVRENSALGRQRGDKLYQVYVSTIPANDAYFSILSGTVPKPENDSGWSTFMQERGMPDDEINNLKAVVPYRPGIIELVPSTNGIVWIGWPFFRYESVKWWWLTEDLEEATVEGHGTIPLKVITTMFPRALKEDDPELKKLLQKVAEAKAGGPKLLVDDVRRLMAMDHHESAEGYELPFDLEADWKVVDPWKFLTGVAYIGDQMSGLFNQAARLAMSGLRVIALDYTRSEKQGDGKEDAKQAAKKAAEDFDRQLAAKLITRSFEDRLFVYLGLTSWKQAKHGKEMGIDKIPEERNALKILAGFGIELLRVRAKNLTLPKELVELLKKPADARAKASAELVTANMNINKEEMLAEALRKKGEGQRDYQGLLGEGDKRRIAAWSAADERAAAAAQARLSQIGMETWGQGVSSTGQGKVVVVGGPGKGTDPIAGAAAALSSIVSGVTDKPAEPTKDKEVSKSKPETPEPESEPE